MPAPNPDILEMKDDAFEEENITTKKPNMAMEIMVAVATNWRLFE
jgi:hypothetical protein